MDPYSIQNTLVAIAKRARDIEIRQFEENEADVLLEQIVPRIRESIQETKNLLDQVSELYEPQEDTVEYENSEVFYQYLDLLVLSDAANEELADLAFVGASELRGMLELFEHLERKASAAGQSSTTVSSGEVLSHCFRGRRKTIKVITAVENTVAKGAGVESRLDFLTELEAALEIRRAYAKLRHAVLNGSTPDAETLRERLHSACTAMAQLRGRDAYWQMRYLDRKELLGLQQRLMAWIREDEARQEPEEGLRLWQDIAAFTRLLEKINLRAELQEHDRRLVEEIRLEFLDIDPQQRRIPDKIFDKLAALYGCDAEIESLIDEDCRRPEAWRPPLERLQKKFRKNVPNQKKDQTSEIESQDSDVDAGAGQFHPLPGSKTRERLIYER